MAPKPDLLGHEADGPEKKFVSPYVTLQRILFWTMDENAILLL